MSDEGRDRHPSVRAMNEAVARAVESKARAEQEQFEWRCIEAFDLTDRHRVGSLHVISENGRLSIACWWFGPST